MMFAFSATAPFPAISCGGRSDANRVPHNAVIAICILAALIMLPAIRNYLVGYYVGTGIAVVGLYIAFILPVILRFRQGDKFQHGAWSLGKNYKWLNLIAIIWVFFICDRVLPAAVQGEHPGSGRLVVGLRQLRPAPRRRRLRPLRRLVGALRQELVQGPRPDGHGGGARAARGEAGDGLRLPADTQYET